MRAEVLFLREGNDDLLIIVVGDFIGHLFFTDGALMDDLGALLSVVSNEYWLH